MKILLDENFPLALERHLRTRGHEVEHIILLGQRGLPDTRIRERLRKEAILFLTQDTEFERFPRDWLGIVVLSRVDQALSVEVRVRLWEAAVDELNGLVKPAAFYELGRDGGVIVVGRGR